MNTIPSSSTTSGPFRIAALLFTLICLGAPLHNASAGDALTTSTTSSSSTTTRKSILSSLFGSRSSSSSSTTGTSSASQFSRSILGLPFGIAKSAASIVYKAASKSVTNHITHN